VQCLTPTRNFLTSPNPPLADNSVSLPGSPLHCKPFDDKLNQDVLIPTDMMVSLIPSIEKLVHENQLNVDLAKTILSTRILPYTVRQLLYQKGINISLQHSQSVSPLSLNLKLNSSNNVVNSPNQSMNYYQHIQSFETTQGLEHHSTNDCSTGEQHTFFSTTSSFV
jgi:hypothetical protein